MLAKRPKQRVSELKSRQPPIAGLNTLAPAAAMDHNFARRLLNFFPGQYSLKVREGYKEWARDLPGVPETLISYIPTSGNARQFVATAVGIVETTSATDPENPPPPPYTILYALLEGRVSSVQMTNLAGTWLVGCNGIDPAFIFDGTTWTGMTNVGAPANPGEINGVNPDKLIAVTMHNKRLWFIERNSMTAWYLPLEAVGGTASIFPLGSVFKRGGKLNSIFTLSVDSGEGMDDLLIFGTDQGEYAAYMGGNVEEFEEWHLSAVHYISKPRTDRPSAQVEGDVYLLTGFGVVSVQSIISNPGKPLEVSKTISKNIYPSIQEELRKRGDEANWEIHTFPMRQMMIVLFPEGTHPGKQFIMNLETGAWAEWDLPATTCQVIGGELYFGYSQIEGEGVAAVRKNRVYRFGDVYRDKISLEGTTWNEIFADFSQAFDFFDQRGINKHFNFVKMVWYSAYPPCYMVDIAVDFLENVDFYVPAVPVCLNVFALWNVAKWDEDFWSQTPYVQYKWDGLGRLGYCASLLVRLRTDRFTELSGIEWAYEQGLSL